MPATTCRRCARAARYAILEGRDDIGGTWDLFRYPGVRSDSDMHTLGYRFKPWTAAKAIADGPSILAYLRETVAEFGIDRHIRFGHLVQRAEWSSDDATWTVTGRAHAPTTGRPSRSTITCNYLFMCSGYYSYGRPYDAEIPGLERFAGQVVHPQFWPDDLDYAGKRVVVIGSGATAMTLVPAMADEAGARHDAAALARPTSCPGPTRTPSPTGCAGCCPTGVAYDITRRKNVALQQFFYDQCQHAAGRSARPSSLELIRKELPDFDVDTHFTPRYNPWDQRLCLIPNGDLFEAIRVGQGRRRHRHHRHRAPRPASA